MTTTLKTVIIFTNQMNELAKFYQSGLSLAMPETSFDDHLGFKIGDMYIGFDQIDSDTLSTSSNVSLWFTVDNLEEVYQKFIDLGGMIKYPPTVKPWGDKLASLYDLDGNIIGLAQRMVTS